MNTIIEIINELQKTSGSNAKMKILKDNATNTVFSELIYLTYNTNINFYVNKFELTSIGNNSIEYEWNSIEDLINNLTNRIITGNAARSAIEYLASTLDKENQEVFKNIFKRDLRINIGIASINKVFGKDFIPEFKVQLANRYDENKKYKTDFWWATPKLDGIRAFWSSSTVDKIYSRNGKEHVGLEHIINELNKIYEDNMFNNSNISFIDGELFTPKIGFNNIQGNVMSNVNYDIENKKQICLNSFAVGCDTFKDTAEMEAAIDYLYEYTAKNNIEHIKFIKAEKINNNPNDIKELARKFVDMGYEGIVLRNPYTYYDFKRSDNLVKFKFFNEDDFIVNDFIEGTGKYTGMLGALIVSNTIDGKYISTEVGTGLTDEDREYIWNNKDTLINKKVEIKYQDVSENSTGTYSLRFPIYKGFKLDR